jgi:Flp pilus assembly protein TadD
MQLSADITFQKAFEHHKAGRLPQAAALYREVLAIDGKHADSLHLLGLIDLQNGRNESAAEHIAEAIALRPKQATYHSDLGTALKNLGRLAEAENSYRGALRLQPGFTAAHYNLGLLLRSQGRLEEAISCYRAVVRLEPDHIQALNNMGVALKNLSRFDEAEACFATALRLQPEYTAALSNLGFIWMYTGRMAQAEASYREIVRREPQNPEAHTNLAHLLLLTGRLPEGWNEYEWRGRALAALGGRPPFAQPQWMGAKIPDRVVLIRAEQGLGDTLQFCRYVPLVAGRARIVLAVQPPLMSLLRNLEGPERIVAIGDPLPPFDYHCPLMSLPRILDTTLDTIPARTAYLKVDDALASVWARRLGELKGLRIGITWAGNPRLHLAGAGATDRRRSVPLEAFAPLADLSGVEWVSLQKDSPAMQASQAPEGMQLLDLMDQVSDFADTAAIIANLDLVISVDTSVVHLAGALGKPIWLLNRFDTCWRWLLERDGSPWYPTLRQFRQKAPGDWEGVIERVRQALVERLT